MKKLLSSLVLVALFFSYIPSASADVMRNPRGSVVVNKGTVYFVGAETLYPFPSMEVFRSYGHVPSDIKPANAADMALKKGPVATLNNRPFGHVDEVTADGYIRGWAVDRDRLVNTDGFTIWAVYDEPYRADGNHKYSVSAGGVMGITRPDVNAALGITGDYGFEVSLIPEVADGKEHTAYVYAVDQESLDKPVQLVGSPMQFTVSGQTSTNDDEFTNELNDSLVILGVVGTIEKLVDYKQANGVYPSTLAGAGIVLGDTAYEPYGACSQSDLEFVYTPTNNYTNFTLKYCLGTDLVYKAFSTDPEVAGLKEYFKQGVNTLNYSAIEQIIALLADQVGYTAGQARDARRLAEVYQLRTALELYYDAHNQYPAALSDLVPTYISSLPVAPTPVDGWCTAENNTYTYQQWYNGTAYDLYFCVGGKTGNYEPGLNVITQ